MLQFLPDGFISDPLEIPLEDSSFVGLQGCWGMLGDAGGCWGMLDLEEDF